MDIKAWLKAQVEARPEDIEFLEGANAVLDALDTQPNLDDITSEHETELEKLRTVNKELKQKYFKAFMGKLDGDEKFEVEEEEHKDEEEKEVLTTDDIIREIEEKR